jgi:hypothetical protein
VQTMATNPEQITDEQIRDLAQLQSAFLAVRGEHRKAQRETLHQDVRERTDAKPEGFSGRPQRSV